MRNTTVEKLKEVNRSLLKFRLQRQYADSPKRMVVNSTDQINLHIALGASDYIEEFLEFAELL